MITKEQILKLAQEHLLDSPRFLVDLTVSSDNQIMLYIDGDESVSISECVDLSRHIEFSLDREEEDFALNVSSAGVDMPLKFIRQYKKYIGKNFDITLLTGEKILARLKDVNGDSIEVIPLKKNPNAKKGTPKKYKEGEPLTLTLDKIKQSKIEIIF
ncbi:MAG: ribosome assembly cofactor RimP [Bacteroidales bacterium]|nr:ribosome assembly cofactor RimP [Bacteroidales bacterium]RLD37392.1 MAG: ribosome assembly cofactor RimP [Bacteroidota bacterium]